jgi:hypothetical protein
MRACKRFSKYSIPALERIVTIIAQDPRLKELGLSIDIQRRLSYR